ncbi:MAG: trypsin-like peptidase domain-containing protein [Corynebacterium sp.]|uniref:S1C family serine protease n=1 Tax=Corynebacterium sp. TaxID=1720 RepID=UPI0026DB478C|nr:trypsin-like peptidase domain-containing protein [Corynebacterium sp.]MDO5030499.1 trypsin-like peptidase domain-containing protein [Corynebacterium sp.]
MSNSFNDSSQGEPLGQNSPYSRDFSGNRAEASTDSTNQFATAGSGWEDPRFTTAMPQYEAYGGAPSNPGGHGKSKPRGKGLSALAVAALVVCSAAIGGGAGAWMASRSQPEVASNNALDKPAETRQVAAADGSVEKVAQKVLPSVVSITTVTGQGMASGSGSILSSDGLVLTNNHVVAGAEQGGEMEVLLSDGTTHPAKLVAGDASTDIAVIRIEGVNGLRPISLGNSAQVQVGQEVVAVGSPLGLTSTVTQGIVSAKNRPVSTQGEDGQSSVIDAIQTDAAINPGNSGGALVDMEGNLIGVPSVIASNTTGNEQAGSIGLGFAIPIDQARRIAEDLIDTGNARMPVIGAQIDTRPITRGALVREVTPDGPADKAGLKRGDVITKLDDRTLDNGVALIAAIRSHRIGDSVTLTVTDERGGNERTIDVTLAEAPN